WCGVEQHVDFACFGLEPYHIVRPNNCHRLPACLQLGVDGVGPPVKRFLRRRKFATAYLVSHGFQRHFLVHPAILCEWVMLQSSMPGALRCALVATPLCSRLQFHLADVVMATRVVA